MVCTLTPPTGSSPLSRGIPDHKGGHFEALRIIPALAGNTPRRPPPCLRGSGSSPLSRGIQWRSFGGSAGPGIIPALAGNTPRGLAGGFPSTDHPRSRGEYMVACCRPLRSGGSSPLSRGIHPPRPPHPPHPGIIPALAGNTKYLRVPDWSIEDHPRSRGEYRVTPASWAARYGSSPLSRGIRSGVHRSASHRGIIPALAGNTPERGPGQGCCWDHPRSRGEYATLVSAPPRLWGIIPALAGNTISLNRRCIAFQDHPRSRGEYRWPRWLLLDT